MDLYEKQLFDFLDKNYYVKENRFFTKYRNIHEWGRTLSDRLALIFYIDGEICDNTLKNWASTKGLIDRAYEESLGSRKLKVSWSPELAQDLSALHGLDAAETRLTAILAEQIAREIDAEILKKLKDEIKTPNELISIVKCVGYEPSMTEYDPTLLTPRKYFVSMNYNDIEHERNINTHWQDWVKNLNP